MAPEVFRGEMYTNKADVYSYGVKIKFNFRLFYMKYFQDKFLI